LSISENLDSDNLPKSQLNKVELQTRLSKEIAYLTLLTVGMLRYEKNDYDGAIKRFTTALAQVDVPNQMSHIAEIYYYLGSAYDKAGANKIDNAIANYGKAIEIKTDYAEAYYYLGNAHSRKGEQDLAIKDYSSATSIKPGYAEAYYNRALVYISKGNRDQAIFDLGNAHRATEIDLNDALRKKDALRATEIRKLCESVRQKLQELGVKKDDLPLCSRAVKV
jgi:tetratricopeptide (TPR) repeat protein